MELIAAFVEVADRLSFSDAAAVLGVTASTVSRRVQQLEDLLAARLLNRTTRRVALTEAGELFRIRCGRALGILDEAAREVGDLVATPQGRLRVHAPMTFGQRHMAPALGDLLARHPRLEVDLILTDELVDLVAQRVDVAVRTGGLGDSRLVARRLAPNTRVLCASPAYLARAGTPVEPEDLAAHSCLAPSFLRQADTWTLTGPGGEQRSVRVTGPVRTNNAEVVTQAALAGVGIAFSATFLTGTHLRSGKLVPVLADWRPPESAIYAVYPNAGYVSPKVRAFIDFYAERFAGVPYWQRSAGSGHAAQV